MCSFTLVVLLLFSLGSSYPLHDEGTMADRMAVNTLDRFKVHVSWHNLSCPVCKVVFTVVDIALWVKKLYLCFVHLSYFVFSAKHFY